ncbi:hypothetical protein [uncultured Dysosmobacter sp.]|uniref:hypothetical protein n=1 Tax=uncultured Dysosmobacter sp. TaxID=2591384 RepID=UPI00260EEE14|nr:hypothetical protein [uncultured Dysosmobacter sp.]
MENHTFKSVAFGGFDKQDVIAYIQQTAQETAAEQEKLRRENEALLSEKEALTGRAAEMESQLAALTAERDRLAAQLREETAARQALASAKEEVEHLTAEVEKLRPDAEAYAQFREKIGAIECEARKRAADLEASTASRLEGMVALFRRRYETLTENFDATATHVNAELRKVEVNLTQLPHALDQAGVELEELAASLKKPE